MRGHGRAACGVAGAARGTIGTMPAPRRPAAPRTGADDDATRGGDRRGSAPRTPAPRTPAPRQPAPRDPAPRTASVPRSPAPAPRSGGAPATRSGSTPATRPSAGQAPAARTPATPRTGAPQQSVPRPATPRPSTSRARSAPPRPAAGRPSSSRPGGRGGSGGDRRGARAETVQQRLPRLFTVRALVMFVVLSIAFVLVFPTLRQYLDQQVRLEQLRAEVAAAEQDNEDLQAELDRWSDPAYVEAQARERLAFVMPGERALRVADPEVVPDDTATDPAATTPGTVESDDPTRPWYAQLWDSVQVAGAAGTGSTGTGTDGSAGTGTTGDNGTAPDGTGTEGSDGEPTAPTP